MKPASPNKAEPSPGATSQSKAPVSPKPSRTQTPASPSPASKTPLKVVRVGISSETLRALGVRHVDADEAYQLVGLGAAGIYIPFPGVEDNGPDVKDKDGKTVKTVQPYGRLRIDNPWGDMKYYQREGTTVHNYVQPSISLVNGDLILVEGEFKSMSLTEAGFPAIGLSGFYGWGKKNCQLPGEPRELVPSFAEVLERLKPRRLVYVGDADTATNSGFWTAMPELAFWTKLPVALPRIDYAAPNGKGVDDIRGKIPDAQFQQWFKDAIQTAEIVLPSTTPEDLMIRLLEREHESIRKLTGDNREKAKDRLIKSGAWVKNTAFDTLAKFAEETLGMNPSSYRKDAQAHRKRKAEEDKRKRGHAGPPISGGSGGDDGDDGDDTENPVFGITDEDVLNRFFMIGKEYYGYSVDPKTGLASKSVSICDKAFVHQSLWAAGYRKKRPSLSTTPVCGYVRNLSEFQAALYYLHKTRLVAMVHRLFQPYGPKAQLDGTRVFNNSQVKVREPADKLIDINSEEIKNTILWLGNLLPGDQLPHFLSLLSYAYCAARIREPKKTRAVFLVGGPDSGKSLLIDYFVPRIFGQETAADAHRLFRGELGASSVLQSYVCKLSDADVGGTQAVKRIQMGILPLLADFTTGGRLLYQNVTTEEVINLFMFSTNPDGSTLNVLKNMPESILEKIVVYNCGGGLRNIETEGTDLASKELNEVHQNIAKHLDRELDCFCSLLNRWEDLYDPTLHFNKRFGVTTFFAEEVKSRFDTDDEESIVAELLTPHDYHHMSALQIYKDLSYDEADKAVLRFIRPARFREILLSLSNLEPELVKVKIHPNKHGSGVKNRFFDVSGNAYAQQLKAEELAAKTQTSNEEAERAKKLAAEEERLKFLRKADLNRRSKRQLGDVEKEIAAMKAAEKAEEEKIAADFAAIQASKGQHAPNPANITKPTQPSESG